MNIFDESFDPLKLDLPKRIETSRLLLRCYQLSDAPVLTQAVADNRERLRDNFRDRVQSVCSEAEAETFIVWKKKQWDAREALHFGIWLKDEHQYVGEVCLKDLEWSVPKSDVGYYVVQHFEGKGIVTEAVKEILPLAFDLLQIRKLQIRCAVDNLRSQQVAERCGFKVEGVLRNDTVRRDGQTLVSLVYYGMTPNDYRASKVKPPLEGGFI
jgi:RimJ/RimL family protein N-acetyltransferase